MQASAILRSPRLAVTPVLQRAQKTVIAPQKGARLVVRASQQQPEERTMVEKLALPAAAVLGAALLFAATPDAAEAARSGGRVGGSSGFRSRAAAPAPAPSRGPVINNYTVAPPLVGGYGYGMPFFPGFGIGYGFGVPIFGGFSFIFNMMLLSIVLSVVWSVISNFTNSAGRRDNDKDDTW